MDNFTKAAVLDELEEDVFPSMTREEIITELKRLLSYRPDCKDLYKAICMVE